MSTTLTSTDRNRIDAAIRSLRLWVLELVAWMAAAFDNRAIRLWLSEEIIATRKDVRYLLMGLVGVALRDGARCRHPRGTRTIKETRHTWTKRAIRRIATRGVRLRTLGDIRAVLDDVHAAAARCARRYCTRVVRDVCDAPWSVGDLAHVRSATSHADEVVRAPDTS